MDFAYPVADCVLLTVALVGAAVAGWRGGRTWSLLASGIVVLAVGDVLWATAGRRREPGQPVMGSNAIYPLCTGSPWPPGLSAAASRARPRPA